MGRRRTDLTGRDFERWFVLERHDASRYLCRCRCGVEKLVYAGNLTSGQSRSCGCLDRELSAERLFIHGQKRTRLYRTWRNMLSRCLNPRASGFYRYGGRGIKVCPEWLFFRNFHRDMGKPPSPLHTLERKNNNGNYEKDNCRWATTSEQARNKSSNRHITIGDRTQILIEWSEETGIPASLIWRRMHVLGWTPEEAISPVHRKVAA
jgi:hypothetical protein